jgi:hypothetical protein
MSDEIQLPELPRLQVPRIDADVDLMDIRQLVKWCEKFAKDYARAAVLADRERRAQPAPGEWIPVCERLPEIGIPVLVYTPRTEYLQHAIDEWVIYREAPVPFSSATIETGEGWGDHDYEDVTHWQPLPEPPKGETQ